QAFLIPSPLEDCVIKRILGIDPGTATVGFGCIDVGGRDTYKYVASGTIQTPKTMNAGQRLSMIRQDMFAILEEYRPDEAAFEAIFFFKNAKTLVPVSQARGGIIESVSTCRFLSTHQCKPRCVLQALVVPIRKWFKKLWRAC
ncbi:MAG TPA: crossover junction endodeoxyribonuclease RuvC, partial [Candidatus Melainabacteria bacterium]|nr:crossover junction endodeoxyribonuclease RuvC [Candidatus Melainabacteria bacterium]